MAEYNFSYLLSAFLVERTEIQVDGPHFNYDILSEWVGLLYSIDDFIGNLPGTEIYKSRTIWYVKEIELFRDTVFELKKNISLVTTRPHNTKELTDVAQWEPIIVFSAVSVEIDEFLESIYRQYGQSFNKNPPAISDYASLLRTQYISQRTKTRYPEIKATDAQITAAVESSVLKGAKNKIDEKFSDIENRLSSHIESAQKNWDEKIDSYLAAQEALVKIGKPVQLWSKAASRHRRNFNIGIAILVVLIFSIAVLVFSNIENISKFVALTNKNDNTATSFTPAATLTLAIIIALITAFGFVLKLAGRFVTNSLTLAEDAEIRSALVDTYLGLTAEETGANSEARDKARTVMLAALFRPLPGYQQEEITAPTVLSLAQDMLGKKVS